MRIKDLMDAIAAHVCIEEGTSDDNWNYKKYADGSLEAERLWNVGQVTVGTQVSSTWRRGGELTIPTPSLMVSGTVVADLVGNTSNSAIVLEHLTNTKIAIAKETATAVTLQNVTLALRTVGARWKTGGGYCIVSFLSAISSFVRRWSHEQENYRPAEVFDRYVLKYSDKYNVRDSGIVCDVSDNRRFKRRIYACWNYWNESKSWRLVSSSSVFERFKSSIELLQSWNSGVHGSSKRHNGNSIVQEGTVALERGCC